jgi:hypothetical protein
MFNRLIALVTQKTAAVTVGVVLASGAAVVTFASQDAEEIFGNDPEITANANTLVETEEAAEVDEPDNDLAEDAHDDNADDCAATPAATDTPGVTPTPKTTETPDATDDHDDINDEEADGENSDAAADHDSDCAEAHDADDGAANDEESDHDDADIRGIPDANPSHESNDDGDCEKGETEIETTPSDTEVNIPCHSDGRGSGDTGSSGDSGSENDVGD